MVSVDVKHHVYFTSHTCAHTGLRVHAHSCSHAANGSIRLKHSNGRVVTTTKGGGGTGWVRGGRKQGWNGGGGGGFRGRGGSGWGVGGGGHWVVGDPVQDPASLARAGVPVDGKQRPTLKTRAGPTVPSLPRLTPSPYILLPRTLLYYVTISQHFKSEQLFSHH